jgi:hypothetical protein
LFTAQAVWECLKNNDPAGSMEIIETYLEVVIKVKAAREQELPRVGMRKRALKSPFFQ